FALHWLSP
ncbi:acrB/AcrD/AcrF family protein, partial [Vibrio parahaemolyticus V-223/04]